MYITRIDIAGLEAAPSAEGIRAHVAITSNKGRILVDCTLAEAQPDAPKCTMALMHEAIRQLRRMPEYRNGRHQIRLADGLLA